MEHNRQRGEHIMARCHYLTVETKVLLTRNKTDQHFSEGWSEEYTLNEFNMRINSEFELVGEDDKTETVRADVSVDTHINTSDEEYKVYKLVYWDPHWRQDGIKFDILYDDFFEVVNDDSWWIDDEDLEFQ